MFNSKRLKQQCTPQPHFINIYFKCDAFQRNQNRDLIKSRLQFPVRVLLKYRVNIIKTIYV